MISKTVLVAAMSAILFMATAAYAGESDSMPGINGSDDTSGGGSAMSMAPDANQAPLPNEPQPNIEGQGTDMTHSDDTGFTK